MLDFITCTSVLRGNLTGFGIYSSVNLGLFPEGIHWAMSSPWLAKGSEGRWSVLKKRRSLLFLPSHEDAPRPVLYSCWHVVQTQVGWSEDGRTWF